MENTEPTNLYGSATVFGSYDDTAPHLDQSIIVSTGRNADAKVWTPQTMPVGQLVALLSQHTEGTKDGVAFVLGEVLGGRRLKNAMKALYGVGLDIDTGLSSEAIDAKLASLDVLAIRYTTHSHNAVTTDFNQGVVAKFAGDSEIDDDVMQRFTREVKFWEADIAASVTVNEIVHTPKGVMVRVDHAPIPKNRVVIPFDSPFVVLDEGATQKEATDKWSKIPHALARHLGIQIDCTGVDPSRLFYFPRHAKGAAHSISLHAGPLYDWRTLQLDDPLDEIARDHGAKGKSKTEAGKALGKWASKYADGLQIADLIRDHAPENVRNEVANGVEILCPFDDGHSNAGDLGDRACLAVNAPESNSGLFVVKCQHESCRGYTNLDHLGKMLEDAWFERADIEREEFISTEVEKDKGEDQTTEPENELAAIFADIEALPEKPDTSAIKSLVSRIATLEKLDQSDAIKALHGKTGRGLTKLSQALNEEIKRQKKAEKAEKRSGASRGQDDQQQKVWESTRKKFALPAELAPPSAAYTRNNGFQYVAFDGDVYLIEKHDHSDKRLSTPMAYKGRVIYRDRGDEEGALFLIQNRDGLVITRDFDIDIATKPEHLKANLIKAGAALTYDGAQFWAEHVGEKRGNQLAAHVFHRPGFRGGLGAGFLSPWGEHCVAPDENRPAMMMARSAQLRRDGADDQDEKPDLSDGQQHAKGTLDGWKTSVAAAIESDLLHFQMGAVAGAVSPLIDLCGYDSICASFWGLERGGKTTVTALMASWWGDTRVKFGLVRSFNSSAQAPEIMFEKASGCGLAIDDTQADNDRDLQEFVYKSSQGAGSDRSKRDMSGLNDVRKWRLLYVVTGEKSLAQKIKETGKPIHGGFTTRVVEININRNWKNIGNLIGVIKGVKENWGHAWFEFISYLIQEGIDRDPQALKASIEGYVDEIAGKGALPKMRDAAHIPALFRKAAELAIAAELLPEFDTKAFALKIWEQGLASEIAVDKAADRFVHRVFKYLRTNRGYTVHVAGETPEGRGAREARRFDLITGTYVKDGPPIPAIAAYVVSKDELLKMSGANDIKVAKDALAAHEWRLSADDAEDKKMKDHLTERLAEQGMHVKGALVTRVATKKDKAGADRKVEEVSWRHVEGWGPGPAFVILAAVVEDALGDVAEDDESGAEGSAAQSAS